MQEDNERRVDDLRESEEARSSEPGWTVREDDVHLIISGLLSPLLLYHEDQPDPDHDGLFLHILLNLLVRKLLVAPLNRPKLILSLAHGPWPGP